MVFCFYIPGGRALTGSGPAFLQTYNETKRFGLILGLSFALQFLVGIWCTADPQSNQLKRNDGFDGEVVFLVASAINALTLLLLWCKGAHKKRTSSSTEEIYVCYNRLRYFGIIAIAFHVYMILCLLRMRTDSNQCYGSASGGDKDVSCDNITYMPSLPTAIGLAVFAVGAVAMCFNFPSNPEPSTPPTFIGGQYAPVNATAVALSPDDNIDLEVGAAQGNYPVAEATPLTNLSEVGK